jgi:hypothetical protein
MTDPIQQILSAGFHEIAGCNCGGVKNRKFKNGAFVILYRARTGLFKLKRTNEVLYPLQSVNNLEKALHEIQVAVAK